MSRSALQPEEVTFFCEQKRHMVWLILPWKAAPGGTVFVTLGWYERMVPN